MITDIGGFIVEIVGDQAEKSSSNVVDQCPACPACQGTGVLGRFFTREVHDCPWCSATGVVTREVLALFLRVEAVTPVSFRPTSAWGTGQRVGRPVPRKA